MPEMQPSLPASPASMPVLPDAPSALVDDPDYAFGCECADPALQIAHWGQEGRSEAA